MRPRSMTGRRRSTSARFSFLFLAAVSRSAAAIAAEEPVNVPGGPASVRRLLRLDPGRPPATFLRDVHEVLLFEGEAQAGWPEVEGRRAVVEFSEDLVLWRREFGASAVFSASSKDGEKNIRRALAWLGMKVEGAPGSWTTESRNDRESLSRRRFFEAIGIPITVFLSRLRAGEEVVVAPRDEPAPLPFGLPAWRQILREPNLTAGDAFLYFVKNVKASRMLSAVDSLDAETLEQIGAVAGGGGGSVAALRVLYERALEPFARFPEAISLHAGRFELPGGREADPIWADVFGVSPSEPGRFLLALYEKDSGMGAYVVDVLQQLPDAVARALVLSPEGFGPRSLERFRRLYRSIEKAGEGIALARRDPDDFGHLARFLRLSAEGDLALSGADLDGETFPRSEAELQEIVAPGRRLPAQTGDVLARLFRAEPGRQGGPTAGRRFLFVSSLIEIRPDLQEPGLVALLLRGVDRFFPAYAVLQDVPVDPALARRYLFALDRLDRRRDSRASEVACGLFQTGAEILAQLARSNALAPAEIRDLFSAYLDLPLFAEESVGPAEGARDLLAWLSDRLLPALRAAERRSIDARRAENARREEAYRSTLRAHGSAGRAGQAEAVRWLLEPICAADDEFIGPMPARIVEERRRLADTEERAEQWIEEALAIESVSHRRVPAPLRLEIPEESATADELLARALVGPLAPARVEWRGGRYLFDPATDELFRRREFRERQRIVSLEDVEEIRRARELLAATAKGDANAARKAIADLATRLQVAQSPDSAPPDRRPSEEEGAAREFVADALRVPDGAAGALPKDVRALDAVAAGRALEAMLGHVYAISAGDPEDLYYQDPDFVRRHSFRRVEKGGKVLVSPFGPTTLAPRESGGGSRVSGSVFGLPDVLGLLHAEQISYNPGAFIGNEQIRSGLVGPVRRMSPARLDDDAMAFVAAACRAAEELAVTLAQKDERERFRSWRDLARDLVPRSRLARLAKLGPGEASGEALAGELSPTDLYRIGRRIALGSATSSASGAARDAKAALLRLREKFGEAGARERLAEFGPQAVAYAGRLRLTDLDLPSYERLADYRTPQLFSDRLYDLKIAAVRAVSEAGLPVAVLPAVLPEAVDKMLADVKMAFAFDWRSLVRRAQGFDARELDLHLERALRTGRLVRDQNADPLEKRQ
ncbi:MAG TPA: hypothetical protein VGA31_12805 [Thermoanaerobaculia bacterium]